MHYAKTAWLMQTKEGIFHKKKIFNLAENTVFKNLLEFYMTIFIISGQQKPSLKQEKRKSNGR